MGNGTSRSGTCAATTHGVSVVIPAHNAARFLDTALRSLAAQTYPGWEAIIVENGSTDQTLEVAGRAAAADPRIRVVSVPPDGVGAARNRGLAEARHDLVLFLDADDHLEPVTFERVIDTLADQPDLDGVRYDWAVESQFGRRLPVSAWELADDGSNLFEAATLYCPIAIHACIWRRERLARAGGFDESLIAGEDWDLWGRLGREGVRLGFVREVLAYYVLHAESATRKNFGRVLCNQLDVIRRLQEADPRVPHPLAQHAAGHAGLNEREARRRALLWMLGLAIGAQSDVDQVLAAMPSPGRGSIDPDQAAATLHYHIPIGAALIADEWDLAWPLVQDHVAPAIERLAAWDGDPALAPRIMRRLEAKILVSADGKLDQVGDTLAAVVDLAGPPVDVATGTASRVMVSVRYGERDLGWVELPAIGGVVPAAMVRRAVVDQLGANAVRNLVRTPTAAVRLAIGGARALAAPAVWRAAFATRPANRATARQEVSALAKYVARRSLERAPIGPAGAPPGHPDERATRPTRSTASGRTCDLPILMYHRVADDGPLPLATWRVSPTAFGEQLALLREAGFESVRLSEWAAAVRSGRPLPGRRIALTFDDGYRDFAEAAVPTLAQYGFTATVFVVTDLVGEASIWDADLGAPAPLMTWSELRAVRDAGIEVASHTRRHRHLTSLTPDAAVAYERAARDRLEQELGAPVTVIAYPYGDIDWAQRLAMQEAGYAVGVTTRHGVANRFDHLMNLPRLDVRGDLAIDEFGAMVGAVDCVPPILGEGRFGKGGFGV